jgi:hypothetical protein
MDAEARNAILNAHLSDPDSDFYKGMCNILRNSVAQEKVVKRSRPAVELPFQLADRDAVALEAQFGVAVVSHGASNRMRLTARVAAMVFCVDDVLWEHGSGPGKQVLQVDGDLVTAAVRGLEGKVIERTGATARLCAGYALEEGVLQQMATVGDRPMNVRARMLLRELMDSGAEHFSPEVRAGGVRVDTVLVNHFKTPVGPHQLANLSRLRGAVVLGAFPFQPDMLVRDAGPLQCFPGRYYVDSKLDVITLVPDADATMSISHPWAALKDLALSNAVTVEGVEYLCERYMSVAGIMFYSIKPIDADFEAPEVLRSYYFSGEEVGVTTLSFPRVKMSSQGVPVGWTRGSVRILTSRYNKVLARVGCIKSSVVTVADVFGALKDYNNLVVNTLDTAICAERMSVEDEQDAALAIALHVNFRRHRMYGTLNVLLGAVKARYAAAGHNIPKLLWLAFSSWLRGPNVGEAKEIDDVASQKLLDWCGNDFGVVVKDVDPWVVVEQEVGNKRTTGGVYYSHFPGADLASLGLPGLEKTVKRQRLRVNKGLLPGRSEIVAPKLSLVDCSVVEMNPVDVCLTDLKQNLKRKMMVEQQATNEVVGMQRVWQTLPTYTDGVGSCPVPDVDPVSAISADLNIAMGGLPQRDNVTTGYRLAEVDIDKSTQGNISVNDAKRAIPKPRQVRRPVIDAGVEGLRIPSQASLLGAVFKRNIGIPNNREAVNLDALPDMAVEKVIQACFREDWMEILSRHLAGGLWEPNDVDIESFLANIDEKKAKQMLDEFFSESDVKLDKWMLMAKGKVKPSREPEAGAKVDHAQTILYLENASTNAIYSSVTRRFKKCLDECLRPEVVLNAQRSSAAAETWDNERQPLRESFPRTYAYGSDMRCYDRAQEHPALRTEMAFYRRMGLSAERLRIWEQTHGPKKAISMLYGVVFSMVLGGVSGLWKTLLRNGLINLATVVVAADLTYRDIVVCDIKGDDMDLELSRAVDVDYVSRRMSAIFNMSAKFFSVRVRYYCKEFRIMVNKRWYHIADPWARVQSLCTPVWVGNSADTLGERWVSFVADLRHYDNGILVEKVAEAAQVHYGLAGCFHGMAKGLAVLCADRNKFFKMFKAPEWVS